MESWAKVMAVNRDDEAASIGMPDVARHRMRPTHTVPVTEDRIRTPRRSGRDIKMKTTRSGRLLFIGLLMACCTAAAGASTVTERTPDAYAEPGDLVNIAENRRLNLRCVGDGAPTVILEAGANADSTTWFRVQPLIAVRTRVCAYDRAGYGFSDEGPKPRTLDADVADL